MNDLVFRKCSDYELQKVEGVLRASFADLNIDPEREFGGKKVLLKPNLLGAHLPEKGVTTHPIIIEAVIRIIKEFAFEIWLGDSPNGVQKSLDDVWMKTGMKELCDRLGVKKKYFEREGGVLKGDILIARPVLEADYIINLPKFKTHGLTLLTAATKNMFGVVPGLKKTDYHRIAKDKTKFSEYIVRIAELRKPDLNILDGIDAMAGNGPSGGYITNVGLIGVGRDMHSIDAALAKLMKVDLRHVDTLDAADRLGIISLEDEFDIKGDDLSSFDMSNFKLPLSYTADLWKYRTFNFLINKLMLNVNVKPRIDLTKCKRCKMCVDICPVSAISFDEGEPYIHNNKCIECFCCHETCPEKGIELRESFLLKIFKHFTSKKG